MAVQATALKQATALLGKKINEVRKAVIEERQNQGTSGTQKVKPSSKKQGFNISRGGTTSYKTDINPTSFIKGITEGSRIAPDYYRNGRLNTLETFVDGKKQKITHWDPIAEKVDASSDNYKGIIANIRLVKPQPKIRSNLSAGTDIIPSFSKFFLEGVREGSQEKYQVVETFNDFYAYFYGEKPPIYTFSGHLLNLRNYNWANEMHYYYSNFWRGTKATELGGKIFLTYNYQQAQGYILGITTDINALTDKAIPFSITLLVTRRLTFSGTKDDGFLSDSLLPLGDVGGFIDNSNPNVQDAKRKINDFLAKNKTNSHELTDVGDQDKSAVIRTQQESLDSAIKQKPLSPAQDANSIIPLGIRRAIDKKAGWIQKLWGFDG